VSPKFKFKREPNVCFSSRSARPLCNCKSRHNGDFNGNDPSANHELEIGWFHHQIAEMQRYIYCHENSNQRINAVAFFKERTRVCCWNPNIGLQKKETVHLRKLGSVLKKKKKPGSSNKTVFSSQWLSNLSLLLHKIPKEIPAKKKLGLQFGYLPQSTKISVHK